MKLLLNDSSTLLNLLAGDCLKEISDVLGFQLVICPLVRDEVKKLRDTSTGEMVQIDIMPHVESGLLQILDLAGEDEQTLFIAQTAVVDDGEAMSIAIAASRKLELAIDDKQARNHINRTFPFLKLWSTPEIIKQWAEAAMLSQDRLRQVTQSIEGRARYRPPSKHTLSGWWKLAARH
jgi:predicted nucleic acid-binding protein